MEIAISVHGTKETDLIACLTTLRNKINNEIDPMYLLFIRPLENLL